MEDRKKVNDIYYQMSELSEEPFAYHKTESFSYKESLRQILHRYGVIPQVIKTFEETAELQELLSRFVVENYLNDGMPIKMDAKAHIAEELADVLIMLSQLMMAFGIEAEVEERMKFKVERQLSRINEPK